MKCLDEYTDRQLIAEITRRVRIRISGHCSYCNRSPDTKPCKMTDQHYLVKADGLLRELQGIEREARKDTLC